MASNENKLIHEAIGAGKWFPANPSTLRREITDYIDSAHVPTINGKIVAAIAPHAGYMYSGAVAGHTFKAIKNNNNDGGRNKTVVVLGISHRISFPGLALLDGDSFRTPLGLAVMDTQTAKIMASESEQISFAYEPHYGEHSAENQIPFLQIAMPEARIVVGLSGEHSKKTVEEITRVLVHLSEKKDIIVLASSDMLHDSNHSLVTTTDKETLTAVETIDHELIVRKWSPEHQIFCGIGPVVIAMKFAEAVGCRSGIVLQYRNSGDDFPESRGNWVVGYGSAVFAT
ncbi:MAG: AmmeMemoRadiSam system protein B [Lentisphaerae bacterium]|nr:AmmeMemoRadiSam system protein B [Lentisphaerota bacterium]